MTDKFGGNKSLNRKLGAVLTGTKCTFTVWAPNVNAVELHLVAPDERIVPMARSDEGGFYTVTLEDAAAGIRYYYRLNGKDVPDPASCHQPEGVHGPSEVCDPAFEWHNESWKGMALHDAIVYELHVGTYTAEGTFEGVIPHLRELKELGITAIEIMPVSQFPGGRNWGYDGVNLYAVQNSYGGPLGLKRLVDAAHQVGIAVILDVVYNHFGPEGNYLSLFGPYFTDRFKTPWGPAVNFDDAHSDHVRRFFIENALYWQTEFHLDGLRLDAVHAIIDNAAIPFLRELKEITQQQAQLLQRPFLLIAESDLNAPRIIQNHFCGGYGLDAQWADDFHHCLHTLLTGESRGYYMDYEGGVAQFAKVWRTGYAFTGEHSRFRQRRHGDFPARCSPGQFVVCTQNHDQVGNRALGERLSVLTDYDSLKLGAAAVLLSPFTPLLFMGEEYGEPAPFQYFVDHTDPDLIKAVQKGRREEFTAFHPEGICPDPASEETFRRARLNHSLAGKGKHKQLRDFYRHLISLRRSYACFTRAEREHLEVKVLEDQQTLLISYRVPSCPEMLLILCFAERATDVHLPETGRSWKILMDSTTEPVEPRQLNQPSRITLQPRSALLLSPL